MRPVCYSDMWDFTCTRSIGHGSPLYHNHVEGHFPPQLSHQVLPTSLKLFDFTVVSSSSPPVHQFSYYSCMYTTCTYTLVHVQSWIHTKLTRIHQLSNELIFSQFHCVPLLNYSTIYTTAWNSSCRSLVLPIHQVIFYSNSRST